MNKKAAIELSLNFLVVLIISLTIFGFGIAFVYQIASGATSIKDLTLEDIDSKISDLNCGANQPICLSTEKIYPEGNEGYIMGVRLLNLESNVNTYRITTTHDKYISKNNQEFVRGGSGFSDFDKVTIIPSEKLEIIEPNQESQFGIAFQMKKGAIKGTYIINFIVEKKRNPSNWDQYGATQKIYIEVK